MRLAVRSTTQHITEGAIVGSALLLESPDNRRFGRSTVVPSAAMSKARALPRKFQSHTARGNELPRVT